MPDTQKKAFEEKVLKQRFKHCFSTKEGIEVLKYLKKRYKYNQRVYAPMLSKASLEFLLGQQEVIIDIVEILNSKED